MASRSMRSTSSAEKRIARPSFIARIRPSCRHRLSVNEQICHRSESCLGVNNCSFVLALFVCMAQTKQNDGKLVRGKLSGIASPPLTGAILLADYTNSAIPLLLAISAPESPFRPPAGLCEKEEKLFFRCRWSQRYRILSLSWERSFS